MPPEHREEDVDLEGICYTNHYYYAPEKFIGSVRLTEGAD
jgi:hypothetical protein